MQKELDAVKEKHLLLAGHLKEALERYVRDAEIVFRSVSDILASGSAPVELATLAEGLHFHHICAVDNDGRVVRAVAVDGRVPPSRLPPSLMEVVGTLHPGNSVAFAPIMPGPDGLPVIYMTRRLSDSQFAVAALGTDYLVELQQAITFGRKGHAAIVDQSGRVLAHPREDWRLSMKDLSELAPVQRMMAGNTGVMLFHSPALDQDLVAGYASVSGAGWGAMVPQPLTELEDSARGLANATLTTSLIGGLAAAILSWWLAGYLARPVVAVTDAARRLARGEAVGGVRLGRYAPKELGSLAASFNVMVGEVSRSNGLLRASEARFRNFAETAADWFWETDEDNRLTYLSERFEESTGTPPSEILGEAFDAVVAGRIDDLDARARFLDVVATRRPLDSFELEWKRHDGSVGVQHVNGIPFHDADGAFRGYRGTGRDITVARQLSEQLSHQASHDSLTGLMNRREFGRRLAQEIEELEHTDAKHALCYLDLDQFKLVNDTSGHVAGDELLRQLGEVLKAHVRRGDLVARLGGDEFGILLRDCSLTEAGRIARGLRDATGAFRFAWEGKAFSVGSSIGLVPVTSESGDIDKVLRQADAACYAAKEKGRNRVHILHGDDEDQVRRQGELQWVHRLNAAMEQGALQLHCQRIIPLAKHGDGGVAYEVLLRLRSGSGQLISGSTLMPAAERYNLAATIDRHVVSRTFAWFRENPQFVRELSMCAINLSGQSLGEEAFTEYVVQQVQDAPLEPQQICFEITETAAIASLASAAEFITALKALGCRFALDDFGTGLCSFAYLKTLPVDYLKIDGGFVREIATDPVDLTMVKSINDMGHALGKQTIAEFVESEEVLDLLREIGVDFAQGYFIGTPVPLDRDSVPSAWASI